MARGIVSKVLLVLALGAGLLPWTSALPAPSRPAADLTRLATVPTKPRVFILSDIGGDVDDSESLVRYLLYANEFDTRGLCATTSRWEMHASVRPDLMRSILRAYGSVVENLNHHVHPKSRYQDAAELLPLVTAGHPVFGKAALDLPPSDGAKLLIERLEESERPLFVTIWGGANTLAEALQHIQRTRSAQKGADLRARLRVYSISDQDDTGEWIRTTFPDVFFIASIHGYTQYGIATWPGISSAYDGASSTKVSAPWLKQHIQIGPLGAAYPTPKYIMEGDSPSWLYLVPNGLGDPEHPSYGSWGGRYVAINLGSRHYSDCVDTVVAPGGQLYAEQAATVYRWRDHFQNDFATRMQWTRTPDFAAAVHPPVPRVNGSAGPRFLSWSVAYGETVVLDAGDTFDPDHPHDLDHLEFEWFQYFEPTYEANIYSGVFNCTLKPLGDGSVIDANDAGFSNVVRGQKVQVTVPQGKSPYEYPIYDHEYLSYHIILQVTTKTKLPVRRYMRVVLNANA